MKMRIAAAALLISTSAMAAGSSAGYGNSQSLDTIESIVQRYNVSGELFRIEGQCHWACTLFLRIRNVCIDPAALLSFNIGHDHPRRAEAIHHLMSGYTDSLRGYLRSNRTMERHDFTTLSGGQMISSFGYRRCPQ
jgi:hypothetical protein